MNEYVLASNEVFLPGQEDCIECNTIQTFTLTLAQQSFCVNLGNNVGPVPVNYAIIDPVADDDEFTITTTYDGTSVTTGPITSASQPPVPSVNKYSIIENTLSIDLDYTPGVTGRPFVVQIQVKCPDAADLSLRLITLNRTEDAAQSIHSEFQWVDGIFTSPLSSTAVKFLAGTNPVISNWQDFTVSQGANLGPTNGSTVIMAYNRIGTDNYTIRPTDRFRWLRSSTRYEQADIASLLADPAISDLVPAGADPEYKADFLMPSTTDEYLYLIWDYSGATPPPAVTPPLDTYTNASRAWGLRKLRTAYSGNCIKVRRDSDDTEQDIGFDGIDLDTTALNTFCSGANGTITRFYDQSGNALDMVADSEVGQVKIYDATTGLVEVNNKPAAFFNGNSRYRQSQSFTHTSISVYSVTQFTGVASDLSRVVWGQRSADGYTWITSDKAYIADTTTVHEINMTDATANQEIRSYTYNSSTGAYTGFIDGASDTSGTFSYGTLRTHTLVGLGSMGNYSAQYKGYIQEVFYFLDDYSNDNADIHDALNAYYAAY